MQQTSAMFSGSGPGAQAPDGCSVELYRLLPYAGDLDALRLQLACCETILELGCGAGRLTRKLLEWGLRPTSVDNSADMLHALPERARRVLAAIESLQLAERFDAVLLASGLINHPEAASRAAFLSAAARHLRPGGRLFIERHDPDWLQTASAGSAGAIGPVAISIESVEHRDSVVAMTLRYTMAARSWSHTFVACSLSQQQVEALLSAHGFDGASWHGSKLRWVSARLRPVDPSDDLPMAAPALKEPES